MESELCPDFVSEKNILTNLPQDIFFSLLIDELLGGDSLAIPECAGEIPGIKTVHLGNLVEVVAFLPSYFNVTYSLLY